MFRVLAYPENRLQIAEDYLRTIHNSDGPHDGSWHLADEKVIMACSGVFFPDDPAPVRTLLTVKLHQFHVGKNAGTQPGRGRGYQKLLWYGWSLKIAVSNPSRIRMEPSLPHISLRCMHLKYRLESDTYAPSTPLTVRPAAYS